MSDDLDPRPDERSPSGRKKRRDAGIPRGPKKDDLTGAIKTFYEFFGSIFAQVDTARNMREWVALHGQPLPEEIGLMMAEVERMPNCGKLIMEHAASCAGPMNAAAQQYEPVYRFFAASGDTGVWVGLAVAHMPIIQGLMLHHVSPMLARRRLAGAEAPVSIPAPETGPEPVPEPVMVGADAGPLD